jgi:hypothetical protein
VPDKPRVGSWQRLKKSAPNKWRSVGNNIPMPSRENMIPLPDYGLTPGLKETNDLSPHPPPSLPLERGGVNGIPSSYSLPFKGRVREGMG